MLICTFKLKKSWILEYSKESGTESRQTEKLGIYINWKQKEDKCYKSYENKWQAIYINWKAKEGE